jgi:hypothetical protein
VLYPKAMMAEERDRLLAERVSKLEQRVHSMAREIESLRREREHIGTLLLESEQQLAVALAATPVLSEETSRLELELADMRSSTSWQITAPLRAVTRRWAARP